MKCTSCYIVAWTTCGSDIYIYIYATVVSSVPILLGMRLCNNVARCMLFYLVLAWVVNPGHRRDREVHKDIVGSKI